MEMDRWWRLAPKGVDFFETHRSCRPDIFVGLVFRSGRTKSTIAIPRRGQVKLLESFKFGFFLQDVVGHEKHFHGLRRLRIRKCQVGRCGCGAPKRGNGGWWVMGVVDMASYIASWMSFALMKQRKTMVNNAVTQKMRVGRQFWQLQTWVLVDLGTQKEPVSCTDSKSAALVFNRDSK